MGTRITRRSEFLVACLAVVVSLALLPGLAEAYDRWSINDDATNCGECHGDFRAGGYVSESDGDPWGASLHDAHRNTMLDGDCNACHSGNPRFPVFLNLSNGGDGLEPVSCMGCHGIDPNPSTPNTEWGAGLRLHHTDAGVPADQNGDTCSDCHSSDPTPIAENVLPSFYFTPDTAHPDKPNDPCNPSPGFPENFAGDTIALDNDGDLTYDGADPDCGASTDIFADGFESGDTSGWSSTVP